MPVTPRSPSADFTVIVLSSAVRLPPVVTWLSTSIATVELSIVSSPVTATPPFADFTYRLLSVISIVSPNMAPSYTVSFTSELSISVAFATLMYPSVLVRLKSVLSLIVSVPPIVALLFRLTIAVESSTSVLPPMPRRPFFAFSVRAVPFTMFSRPSTVLTSNALPFVSVISTVELSMEALPSASRLPSEDTAVRMLSVTARLPPVTILFLTSISTVDPVIVSSPVTSIPPLSEVTDSLLAFATFSVFWSSAPLFSVSLTVALSIVTASLAIRPPVVVVMSRAPPAATFSAASNTLSCSVIMVALEFVPLMVVSPIIRMPLLSDSAVSVAPFRMSSVPAIRISARPAAAPSCVLMVILEALFS